MSSVPKMLEAYFVIASALTFTGTRLLLSDTELGAPADCTNCAFVSTWLWLVVLLEVLRCTALDNAGDALRLFLRGFLLAKLGVLEASEVVAVDSFLFRSASSALGPATVFK